MTEKKFTNELKKAFDYIKNNILKAYDCDKISTEYFIVSILENDDTVGNKVLSKVMLHDSMQDAKSHFYQWLSQNTRSFGGTKEYDEVFEKCIKQSNLMATQQNSPTINSGHILLSIVTNNREINKYFRSIGVTSAQINNQVVEETNNITAEENKNTKETLSAKPVKHVKKAKKEEKKDIDNVANPQEIIMLQPSSRNKPIGECEHLFTNLNNKASAGQIEKVYGNEKIYSQIFTVLSKKNKNNIIITGESGVGKSATVMHLANMIVNKEVPKNFADKVLLNVDVNSLIMNTGMRGAFEAKMKAILADAQQRANYIFFIDSIESLNNSTENDCDNFIENVMREKNIMLICTCSEKAYSKEIGDYPHWARYFEKVTLEEPNEEICYNILKQHSEKLEYFHNVKYDEDVFNTCVKYCKRYITDRFLPDSAIDILDTIGAKISLSDNENEVITEIRNKLDKIQKEKEQLKLTPNKKDYDKIDSLEKEEISLNSELDCAIKRYNLEKEKPLITSVDIKECISEKTNIPINDLTVDDKEKLKNINDKLKKIVIGQDEAVDAVCKAIKRQRIGISNPNKPVVFLMAGSTGVGKSYLAKTIAKEIFGDEKKLIRLDMAEYADKTSVNKILGSSAGYVGYQEGGILTEAIKKNKHCVLLLDEIEKADEEVHNAFLSVFDEGRLTDNKGITVDFKNVIVIMTSNVGAKELDERGNGIGFVTNTEDIRKTIIEKELKRKFKPEFLNRIDNIVYFNNLTDKQIKDIIVLEIGKLKKRLEYLGYDIDENIKNSKIFENIFEKVKEKKKQGARPIIREIQTQIEDKITDLIIEKNIEKGYVFNESDLSE